MKLVIEIIALESMDENKNPCLVLQPYMDLHSTDLFCNCSTFEDFVDRKRAECDLLMEAARLLSPAMNKMTSLRLGLETSASRRARCTRDQCEVPQTDPTTGEGQRGHPHLH